MIGSLRGSGLALSGGLTWTRPWRIIAAMATQNRGWGWIGGTLAVFLAFGCTQAKKPASVASIAWHEAYDAGVKDAATNHRPILLDFYTDW